MAQGETTTPVITLPVRRFQKFLERETTADELEDNVPYLGVDIEEVSEDSIKIEYNPNRPDLGTIAGVAKAYKGIQGYETGLIPYDAKDSDLTLRVEPSVEEVRPYLVGAVAKNVELDEATLKEVIALQEDLHHGYGRQRKKVSIGIHNLEPVDFPLTYSAVGADDLRFRPLGQTREMTPGEVLRNLDTGKKHGHIIEGTGLFPLITDDSGRVLSMPPVINSEYTRITPGVDGLFLDVTATDLERAADILNVLTTTLADYGADIYKLSVETDRRIEETPDFTPHERAVETTYINSVLGMDLSQRDVRESLEASRFGCSIDGDSLRVEVPPYRVDIMHPVDLTEEVAIGYGYQDIEPTQPTLYQPGEKLYESEFRSATAELMVGCGFQEVVSSTLSNRDLQFRSLALQPEGHVKLARPKSVENEMVRTWILPQLLEVLTVSKKEPHPQKVFEIGRVARRNHSIQEEEHLGILTSHGSAGYSEVKAVLDLFERYFEVEWSVEGRSHPSFIDGRAGTVLLGGREAGLIGEIHPRVLERFQLETPVAGLELDLGPLRSFVRDGA